MAAQENLPEARAANEATQMESNDVPMSPVAKTANDLLASFGTTDAPSTSVGLSSPQGAPMPHETPVASTSGPHEHVQESMANEQSFEGITVGEEEYRSLTPTTPKTAVMHFSAVAAAMTGNYMTADGATLSEGENVRRVTVTGGTMSAAGVGNGVSDGEQTSPIRPFARVAAVEEMAAGRGSKAVRAGGPAARATAGKIGNSREKKIAAANSTGVRFAAQDTPVTATSNSIREQSTSTSRRFQSTATSRRVPRAPTAEDFDFSFVYDYGGYKPSSGGSRAERLKARAAKADPSDASGDGGVDDKADARESKADGGAFFKPEPPGHNEAYLKDFMIVVNKIRKERIAAGRANLPTKEELEQVRWVRCCECGKHRALPKGVTLDEMLEMYGLQHKKIWMCPRNTWDPEYATCAKPQNVVTRSEEDIVDPLRGTGSGNTHLNDTLRGGAGGNVSGGHGSEMPDLGIGRRLDSGMGSTASLRRCGTEVTNERDAGGGNGDSAAYGGSDLNRLCAHDGGRSAASGGSINHLIQAMEPRKRHREVDDDSDKVKTRAAPLSVGFGGQGVAVGDGSGAGDDRAKLGFKREDEGFPLAEPEPDENMLKAVDVLVVLRGVFG